MDAEGDGQPDHEHRPRIAARWPGEAFRTASPSPKEPHGARDRAREPRREGRSTALRDAHREVGVTVREEQDGEDREGARGGADPGHAQRREHRPAHLLVGHGNHVEVEREKGESRDEVTTLSRTMDGEPALVGMGSCARSGRPGDLTRAGDEEPGHEADDGRGEGAGERARAQRGEEEPQRHARAL